MPVAARFAVLADAARASGPQMRCSAAFAGAAGRMLMRPYRVSAGPWRPARRMGDPSAWVSVSGHQTTLLKGGKLFLAHRLPQ